MIERNLITKKHPMNYKKTNNTKQQNEEK